MREKQRPMDPDEAGLNYESQEGEAIAQIKRELAFDDFVSDKCELTGIGGDFRLMVELHELPQSELAEIAGLVKHCYFLSQMQALKEFAATTKRANHLKLGEILYRHVMKQMEFYFKDESDLQGEDQ